MARLWDIVDAARRISDFTSGMRFAEFHADRRTRDAVERNFEIIGEAARNVSAPCRDALPEVPWRSMIALRNVLAHEYGEVRHEVLWHVIQEQLPGLVRTLQATGVDEPPA